MIIVLVLRVQNSGNLKQKSSTKTLENLMKTTLYQIIRQNFDLKIPTTKSFRHVRIHKQTKNDKT